MTKIKHTLQDAAALYREGRLEEAGAICAALLRITPGDFDARHLQGLIAFQAKDFQRAADVIGAALEITPHPLAYNNRGAALLELKQTAQALECFDKALALKPDFVSALNNRGNALRALRRTAEAVTAYDAALSRRPDYAEAWYNRGLALDEMKDHAEAIKSYRQAIAFKPDYADAWSNRGVALANVGRWAEALQCYERAIAADPEHACAHWNMSLCFLQLGDFKRGWAGHEWRWKVANLSLEPRTFPRPLWLG